MDTYSESNEHPTRTNPQVLKRVTSNISFFKTICRVVLVRNDPDRPSYEEVERIVRRVLPFMKDHYLEVRGDIDTHRHLNKEVVDAIACLNKTMIKYRPPYPNPRLSPRKRQEVLLSVSLLESGLPVSATYIMDTLGPIKGDRTGLQEV
jgi:hypothetical protein